MRPVLSSLLFVLVSAVSIPASADVPSASAEWDLSRRLRLVAGGGVGVGGTARVRGDFETNVDLGPTPSTEAILQVPFSERGFVGFGLLIDAFQEDPVVSRARGVAGSLIGEIGARRAFGRFEPFAKLRFGWAIGERNLFQDGEGRFGILMGAEAGATLWAGSRFGFYLSGGIRSHLFFLGGDNADATARIPQGRVGFGLTWRL